MSCYVYELLRIYELLCLWVFMSISCCFYKLLCHVSMSYCVYSLLCLWVVLLFLWVFVSINCCVYSSVGYPQHFFNRSQLQILWKIVDIFEKRFRIQIWYFRIPESINTNISYQLFDYTIPFVNPQH